MKKTQKDRKVQKNLCSRLVPIRLDNKTKRKKIQQKIDNKIQQKKRRKRRQKVNKKLRKKTKKTFAAGLPQ